MKLFLAKRCLFCFVLCRVQGAGAALFHLLTAPVNQTASIFGLNRTLSIYKFIIWNTYGLQVKTCTAVVPRFMGAEVTIYSKRAIACEARFSQRSDRWASPALVSQNLSVLTLDTFSM